jgi:hypothetical protein
VRTDKPPDFTKLPVDPRTVPSGRGLPPRAPVPAKSTAPPAETKGTGAPELKTTPDAVRHANQAAGGRGDMPQP